VWTTRGFCGRAERGKNSSTDGPKPSTGRQPGCPHGRTGPELGKQGLSTQSTTPITVTAFKTFEEKTKTKTGSGASWGQLAVEASFVDKSMVRSM
jgi:hypothetical protein